MQIGNPYNSDLHQPLMEGQGPEVKDSSTPKGEPLPTVAQALKQLTGSLSVISYEPGERPSAKLTKFLNAIQISDEDLREADVSISALNQLMELPISRRILVWSTLESAFNKLALLPWLDEQGVKVSEEDQVLVEKGCCSALASLAECCKSRIWVDASGIPFQSEKILKRIYTVNGFFEGAESWLSKIWSLILYSSLTYDLYFYYSYRNPDQRFQTSLSSIFFRQVDNTKSVVASFIEPMPFVKIPPYAALLAAGFSWGLLMAIWGRCTHDISPEKIERWVKTLTKEYKAGGAWKELFSWLVSPIQKEYDALYYIRRALLWDSREEVMQNSEKLFSALQHFGRHSRLYAQYQALLALSDVATAVSFRNLMRLAKLEVSPENIIKHLQLRGQAFKELEYLAKHYFLPEQDPRRKEIDPSSSRCALVMNCLLNTAIAPVNPLFRYILANYLVWYLGKYEKPSDKPLSRFYLLNSLLRWQFPADKPILSQIPSQFAHLFFWGVQGLLLYTRIKLWITISEGLNLFISRLLDQRRCEAAGYIWSFAEFFDNYICSFCADLPVAYEDAFAPLTCLNFLLEPREQAQILALLDRYRPEHNITRLSLSAQNLSNTTNLLRNALPIIARRMPNLLELDLASFKGPMGPDEAPYLATFLNQMALTFLDLSFNNLGVSITAAITDIVPSLRVLKLIHCNLNTPGAAKALGNILHLLSGLQDLDLRSNNLGDQAIEDLAPELGNSTVVTVDFSSNKISNIAALAAPVRKSRLTTLLLGSNNIGDDELIKFLQAFSQETGIPPLKFLDLISNQIGDSGVQALAIALLNFPDLLELHLTDNNIRDAGAQALFGVLADLQQLQKLILAVNLIGPDGVNNIKNLPKSLQELDISSNRLGLGAKKVLEAIPGSGLQIVNLANNRIVAEALVGFTTDSVLEDLDLSNNLLSNGTRWLAPALKNLRVLHLGNNKLTAADIENLVAQGLGNLQTLILDDNKFGDTESLARNLGKLLQTLSLKSTGLTPKDARTLGLAVRGSGLLRLILDENPIGLDGAQGIGEGAMDSSLQDLSLSNCGLGAKEVTALVAGMMKRWKIKILRLDGNPFGSQGGMESIAKQLRDAVLEELYVRFCELDDPDAIAFGEGVSGSVLQVADFSGNKIGNPGGNAIARALVQVNFNWVNLFNRNVRFAVVHAPSNTNLVELNLRNNRLGTPAARSLCFAQPRTSISKGRFNIFDNPFVEEGVIDPGTCHDNGGIPDPGDGDGVHNGGKHNDSKPDTGAVITTQAMNTIRAMNPNSSVKSDSSRPQPPLLLRVMYQGTMYLVSPINYLGQGVKAVTATVANAFAGQNVSSKEEFPTTKQSAENGVPVIMAVHTAGYTGNHTPLSVPPSLALPASDFKSHPDSANNSDQRSIPSNFVFSFFMVFIPAINKLCENLGWFGYKRLPSAVTVKFENTYTTLLKEGGVLLNKIGEHPILNRRAEYKLAKQAYEQAQLYFKLYFQNPDDPHHLVALTENDQVLQLILQAAQGFTRIEDLQLQIEQHPNWIEQVAKFRKEAAVVEKELAELKNLNSETHKLNTLKTQRDVIIEKLNALEELQNLPAYKEVRKKQNFVYHQLQADGLDPEEETRLETRWNELEAQIEALVRREFNILAADGLKPKDVEGLEKQWDELEAQIKHLKPNHNDKVFDKPYSVLKEIDDKLGSGCLPQDFSFVRKKLDQVTDLLSKIKQANKPEETCVQRKETVVSNSQPVRISGNLQKYKSPKVQTVFFAPTVRQTDALAISVASQAQLPNSNMQVPTIANLLLARGVSLPTLHS